jgi:hypothetical protein
MAYVRVSHMVPRAGQEAAVEDILRKLSAFYPAQPGYITGWILTPHEHTATRRLGRVGVWATEDDAERAAQASHALALRSELMRVVEEDSHQELSFQGEPDQAH